MTSLAATVLTRIRSVRYYTFARDVKTLFTFLLVRRYASASTGYGAASVSATSRLSIARDRRVEAVFLVWRLLSTSPVLCYKEIQVGYLLK